jgi:hypothetical protein
MKNALAWLKANKVETVIIVMATVGIMAIGTLLAGL